MKLENLMRKLACTIILISTFTSLYSQETQSNQSFHLGLAGVSTFTKSEMKVDDVNFVDTVSYNPFDFGVYCGNEFKLGGRYILDLEFFYLNNRVEISRNLNRRFELHQNIGCLIKPGIIIEKHRACLDIGIAAVYAFDKDEEFGNQFDRFDQAIFFGGSYDYRIDENISIQLKYLHAKFNSISHYTQNELKQFSIISLGLNYHLD